jgi:predicted nucleotide-binding protein (sugar kinase/HSP70/actin superfamily)
LGLNDVIRNVIPGLPPLLGPMVNYKGPQRVTLEESFLSLAGDVGLPVRRIKEAFQEAFDLWQRHQEEVGQARGIPRDLLPEDLARYLDRPGAEAPRFRLGVIGRPYLLFDPVLSHRLIKKLASFSSELTFYQGIPTAEREAQAGRLSKPVYWSLGRDLVAASVSFSQWEGIDGLINVSSFACGQDAFTSYLIDHYARLGSEKPVLSLVLDEHTSAVGLQTRLEAYFDLLESRLLQEKTIPCN